jgi:N-acyl-phosphatidylethanolamine-hydrolysing phospholipase D
MGKPRRIGKSPTPVNPPHNLDERSAAPRVTWIGHSTFLIQIGELNLLTDPIWSERASPVQFAGPRRISPPGVVFDNLPTIDAVILSHDHYDHLDSGTVDKLKRSHPAARWFVPLGVGKWLEKKRVGNVSEHDWDDVIGWRGLQLTCIPAQHFSGRSLTDRDSTLWCGWTVRSGTDVIMFAGDTGLHPEFARIAEAYGPLSVAILPIGAYDPRWFMKPVHMDPDDAFEAYRSILNVNADQRCVFIPSHWGTFVLTDEPADEPPMRLRQAWDDAGLPPENCVILRPGESFLYHL